MHRRSLPVVACPLVEQVVAEGGRCRQCEKTVHDLSAMTSRQARRFLRRNRDRSICVAYRVAPDGRIRFRPSETGRTLRMVSLPLLLGGLGGCASLGRELEIPDDITCLPHRGHRVDCDEAAYAGYDWRPDALDEVARASEDAIQHDPRSQATDEPGDPAIELEAPDDPTTFDDDEADDADETGHEDATYFDDDVVLGGVLPLDERRSGRPTRRERRQERRAARKRSHPLGCRIPAPKPDLAEQGTWSWSWSWSWS
jgi:hypothetical protein